MKIRVPIGLDRTQLCGLLVIMLLFCFGTGAKIGLSWQFVHSTHDVAVLFADPLIVLAFIMGLGLGIGMARS